jgi:hypothetical protein
MVGAAIIGLLIFGARLVGSGRYEISAFGGGNYGVWRVDTLTGDVQICKLTPSDVTPDKQNNPSEKTLDPDENNPFAKLATPGDVPPAKTFFAVPAAAQ